jgi:NAD+ diphosphatase
MGGEIPMTGAAVVALATNGIIAIAFRSWVLTGRASAHGGQVYRAPNDFTNSDWRMGPDPQYCGRCGSRTQTKEKERAKVCPQCGLHNFPRRSPAIIVAVERGEEILLARSAHFPRGMFSVLAGFVEPGETIEECVVREVKEEVGITVGNIRYFGSQPWPFPNSLMLGFTAEYVGGELVLDPTEIAEAGWFRADALPSIPGRISIAGRMIQWFVEKSRPTR